MLQAIRSRTGSWIVKILFALLVLSFAVWGIGDIFRDAGPDTVVAEAGDVEITAAALDRALQPQIDTYRNLFGPEFDTQQAFELGIVDDTLMRLVTAALAQQEAATLGLSPPDALVRARIQATREFQDATGRFDPFQFAQVLSFVGLSEANYVAQLRSDIASQLVYGAVATGARAPETAMEFLHRYRGERRVAEVVTFLNDSITGIAEPDEAALQAFHEENGQRYEAPEYRALSVLALRPEDVFEQIPVDETAVAEAYDARVRFVRAAERRGFDQVIVDDVTTAQAIADAARATGSLWETAAAAEDGPEVVTLDPTTRDGMVDMALAEAGFGLAEVGDVSVPVQTPFGWHVLALTSVESEPVPPFDEVRDGIVADLKREEALIILFEQSNNMIDAFAGGASLAVAAEAGGAQVIDVPPIGRDGRLQDGSLYDGSDVVLAALASAFQADPADEPRLEETADGFYFAFTIDVVVDPAVRPLAEVRDEVAEDWRAEQASTAAAALAETAVGQLRTVASAQSIADELGGLVDETPELLRDGSTAEGLEQAAVNLIFELGPGEAGSVALSDRHLAIRVIDILPAATSGTDAEDMQEILASELLQGIERDLLAQFDAALETAHSVDIRQDRVERYLLISP